MFKEKKSLRTPGLEDWGFSHVISARPPDLQREKEDRGLNSIRWQNIIARNETPIKTLDIRFSSVEIPGWWRDGSAGRVMCPDSIESSVFKTFPGLVLGLFIWLSLSCILDNKTIIISSMSCSSNLANPRGHRNTQICSHLVRSAVAWGSPEFVAGMWRSWGRCVGD